MKLFLILVRNPDGAVTNLYKFDECDDRMLWMSTPGRRNYPRIVGEGPYLYITEGFTDGLVLHEMLKHEGFTFSIMARPGARTYNELWNKFSVVSAAQKVTILGG